MTNPSWPSVHPFPARMAHAIALDALLRLPKGSRILDPMCGSGTVLRAAVETGHSAVGFDVDPLAVLMARVWTTAVDANRLQRAAREIVTEARSMKDDEVHLPWVVTGSETASFMRYWFAVKQRLQVGRLATVLRRRRGATGDALKLALTLLRQNRDELTG
jgi:SAM-dependent methyltransferase